MFLSQAPQGISETTIGQDRVIGILPVPHPGNPPNAVLRSRWKYHLLVPRFIAIVLTEHISYRYSSLQPLLHPLRDSSFSIPL